MSTGNDAEGGSQSTPLEIGVHPETRLAVQGIREIHLPIGLQLLPLVLREDAVDQFPGFVRAEHRVVEVLEMAVHAHHRRHADGEVQVGSLPLQVSLSMSPCP